MLISDLIENTITPSSSIAAPPQSTQPGMPQSPSTPTTPENESDDEKTINLIANADGITYKGLTDKDSNTAQGVLGSQTPAKKAPNGQDTTNNMISMAKAKGFNVKVHGQADNSVPMNESAELIDIKRLAGLSSNRN